MFRELIPALRLMTLFTVLTGVLYPALITAVCQAVFPHQANGSLIERGGKVVGSHWIGQNFAKAEYFHPRPSAAGSGYDATASSGSNLGPTNPKLIERVKTDIAKLRVDNPGYEGPIPADAVTASGSGLDPHISLAYATLQAARVARARHVEQWRVQGLVANLTEGVVLGFLGEPRVNVLRLNLALDEQMPVR